MSNINLLDETVRVLELNELSPSDVEYVYCYKGWFTWNEFAELANVYYDNGYGGANVPEDLRIVGKDWWLERGEYDGSEWWNHKSMPVKPDKQIHPTKILYNIEV